MKKLILLTIVACFHIAAKAQSFQLLQLSDSLPAANSYTVNITSGDPTFVREFIVKNVSANNKTTKIRKTVLSTATGQDIFFCYDITCYTPTTTLGNPVTINAGQQLPAGTHYGLRTEFDNNAVVGTSVVKYSVFDVVSTNDTANVYITYNVTAASGISTISSNLQAPKAFPNPATGTVNFSYNLKSIAESATLKIYNAIGATVKIIPLSVAETSVKLDVSDLQEGFYYYMITSNTGTCSATKKLVIER